MILVSKTYWGGMPFWFRRPPEDCELTSLVLRAHDLRQLRGLYWTSRKHPKPKVGVVLMHPRVDFTHHYAIPRLVAAGHAVLAANTRLAGNDALGEHEEMVLDLGACVRHLKEKRGVEKVVLFANCGGASLGAFYQAQATTAPSERLGRSPGGSPTHFEAATLPPADGIVYVAPHRGQGKVLEAAIDPSITDEADLLSVDPALDMYDARNGFQAPPAWSRYTTEFLVRYRSAQVERVRRIDTIARAAIARRAEATTERERAAEPMLVIHRTMANPAFVDDTIDPSPREYGSLLSERPDLMNYAALGLARTCTPRAWLSTWSGQTSNADLVKNVARIAEPTLLVHAERDREIFPADVAAIESAIAAADKTTVRQNARHYFEPDFGEKTAPDVDKLMDVVLPWIAERFL